MIDPKKSYPEVPREKTTIKRRDRLILELQNEHLTVRRISARRSIPDDLFMMSWEMARQTSNRLLKIIEDLLKTASNIFSEKLVLDLWMLGENDLALEWV